MPVEADATIGTLMERPPRPWSATSARRYSTPSGRAITNVSGTFGAADAARITQQRGHGNRLTGAIDAAFRIDEGIESGRNRPSGNATIGQIERRRFQAQESVVVLLAGNDCGRCDAALPARKTGLEMDETVAVSLANRKHLVVACNQPHLDAAARLGARQRVDKDINAVMRGVGGEPEIGNDEPLRRLLPVFIGDDILRLGGHGVDARPEILDRLVERKCSCHLCIELGLDGEFTAPYLGATLVGQALGLIAAQIALEVVAKKRVDEIAVANSINRKRDCFGIDAEHRNAALARTRQHVSLA